MNILTHSRALSPSRIGLIVGAALAAVSGSTADVADPAARLPSVIQQLPATNAPSPERRDVGLVSPASRGAGGSVWL